MYSKQVKIVQVKIFPHMFSDKVTAKLPKKIHPSERKISRTSTAAATPSILRSENCARSISNVYTSINSAHILIAGLQFNREMPRMLRG